MRRYEAEHEPDEEYQRWMDIYHPQNTRKLSYDGITSHTHVDKVTTFIPAPANAHDQLTEATAALTSLPKTKPKAAAHGRVLTSAENLKIIEDQQKEKELKKGKKQIKKSKGTSSTKNKTASLSGSKLLATLMCYSVYK